MIVYLATKADFRADILSKRIEEKVLEVFKGGFGKSVGESELQSWQNSLPYRDRGLADDGIPHDTGVALEFNIPQTSKRIDFIHAPSYAEHTKADHRFPETQGPATCNPLH